MALNILRRSKLSGSLILTSRKYCEEKSVYERHEAGRQPRKVRGEIYPEWRKPWVEREGEWTSKLSLFVEKSPSMNLLNAMQKLPDLALQDIKDWWAEMKVIQEIKNQEFLPERVKSLGTNLAAVHFFVYRQGAVRLKNSKQWIYGDAVSIELPDHFVEGYFVEAIDCSNFHHNGIRYEGLQNLSGLNFLKWLSLRNNKFVDVWGIDRVAGQNGNTLEFLDVVGCNICVGCVKSLARMNALRFLVLSEPGDNIELQVALSMLEQEKPNLIIRTIESSEDLSSETKSENVKLDPVTS